MPTSRSPGSIVDSAIVVIVQWGTFPAIFAASLEVRSGLCTGQLSPRSYDLNSRLPPK